MNANELADYLDNNAEAMIMSEQPYIDQAATMLRQQQAENKELKTMRGNSVLVPSDKLKEMQAELDSLRSVVYWLKENRPEVWDDIKKWSKM